MNDYLSRNLAMVTAPNEDFLHQELKAAKVQISRLIAQDQGGALVYGGPIRTAPAANWFAQGPFQRDLDSSFPITFSLRVPDFLLRIIQCRITLTPRAIRSSVTVASSGGGATSGSSSASTSDASSAASSGASTASSTGASTSSTTPALSSAFRLFVHEDGHIHQWADFVTTATNPLSEKTFTTGRAALPGGDFGSRQIELRSLSDTDLYTGSEFGGSTYEVASWDHNHNIAHTHGIAHTHNIAHTHGIAHTHTISAHTHPLTLGIAESGMATAMQITIDGVNRTVALGGPWNAEATFDITDYLLDNGLPRKPVIGSHPIILESSAVGAIEVSIDWYVIAKPVNAW